MKILITGHSRGLGAAITRQLLKDGHSVLGLSRGALSHPEDKTSGALVQQSLDLSNPGDVRRFLDSKTLHQFFQNASHAVLINNAGLLQPIGQAGTLNAAAIFDAVTTNLASVVALTDSFIRATQSVSDRRIVQLSSGAARSPYAGWSVYCATKAGLDHYTRCVALEIESNAEVETESRASLRGLRIESLAPGIIDTDMQAEVRATSLSQFPMRPKFDQLKAAGALAHPDVVAKQLLTHVMSDRFGRQQLTDLRQSS
jgi:NAD(P)-dependent dehydrogenase (short-subunit alcohol dehydrogenase family)